MDKRINIGGVREYFNLPWDLCFEQGLFEAQGIIASWQDCHGGTGEMLGKLRDGSLDIAIALTEGVVTGIVNGNPCKIIQFFVNNPLVWGVHVPAHSEITELSEIEGKKYAISRYKSGSHLMAYVNASMLGIEIDQEDFVVVGNLEGARASMKEMESQVFFWEKHTTQPYVDNGEFRRIADFSAPWPCFAIVVREDVWETNKDEVNQIIDLVMNKANTLTQNPGHTKALISSRFKLRPEEVEILWEKLDWNTQKQPHLAALGKVISSLQKVGILDSELEYNLEDCLV